MRVIAGKWKGRSLIAPTGHIARPTTDRVKESMFNLMGIAWSGGTVLDLFAGSGALGLEALSRGAKACVFVDQSTHSLRAIRENLERCQAVQLATVWKRDWKSALVQFFTENQSVGWVFLDPPYEKNLWQPILEHISTSDIIVDYGIVCEHPKHIELPETVGRFAILKRKVYGDIAVTIYVQCFDQET